MMEKVWFYALQGAAERQGPVPESEIRNLLANGQLSTADLAWAEGMNNWTPLGQIAAFQAEPAAVPPAESALAGAPPAKAGPPANEPGVALPQGLTSWMTFVGVMTILSGIFMCLTCVSAIVGIFMIIGGSALLAAKTALASVPRVDPALQLFFQKLKVSVLMNGIVYIVNIVLFFILMALYSTAVVSALRSLPRN